MIAIALLFILIFCRAGLLALCAVLGSRNKERQGLDYVSGVEQTFHLGTRRAWARSRHYGERPTIRNHAIGIAWHIVEVISGRTVPECCGPLRGECCHGSRRCVTVTMAARRSLLIAAREPRKRSVLVASP
jgi:hypothetical protein